MGRACSTYGERIRAYRVLVEKPEGGRPLGRPRHRWEDDIKMDLQQVEWWAVVNAVMNLRFPQNAGNFLSS
jgi:hypothetical protein